jgi:hypothetical protein
MPLADCSPGIRGRARLISTGTYLILVAFLKKTQKFY